MFILNIVSSTIKVMHVFGSIKKYYFIKTYEIFTGKELS